jgi:DNA-binding CsgD family transcriptional regulator/tetratricopeptide (TPR) repeat protein
MNHLLGLLDGGAGTGGVVIAGGAGVGKTRLAREVGSTAANRGWVVRTLQGTAAAQTIPLGAFSQWLNELDDQPLNLVSSAIAAVATSPDSAPVMVVVDDVHLLDDLSAFVLHQLVRREAATVIATLRTGEPVPRTVTELWKDGHLQRLDLQPLDREECAGLLERALGGPVSDQSATRLWELTRGNVLFLHELVRQELQAGRLIDAERGEWTWTGSITVSPSLADLVDTYIGAVPEPVLEVLEVLAVAEPLEFSYLSLLVDPQAIEDAERFELIQVSHDRPTDVVQIGHPLYGEACRSRLGRVRARRLRGRIASAMSSPHSGAERADPVRLALLWLDSDLPGDADIHHKGAAAAFRRLDMALSEQLAEAAIRAGTSKAMESRILHARTLSMLGRGEEAEQFLAALPAGDELDDAWVAAKVLRALNLLLTLGRPELSWTVIEEALTEAPAKSDQELLAFRALQLAMAARPAEVISLLDSIDYDRLTADARINLNYGTTIAFGELGRLEQATQTSEDNFVLGTDSPVNAFQAVSLAQMHIDALCANGHISEALELSKRVEQQWTDLPEVPRTIAAALCGVSALANGDMSIARETLSVAMANEVLSLDAVGLPFLGIGYWLRIAHTEALARAGDTDAAHGALVELQGSRHPSFAFLEPNRMLAAAWVAAARGRTSEALGLVAEAAEYARSHGQHAREVLCLQNAIQLGDSEDHSQRLTELVTLVKEPRAALVAQWASAKAAHDGEALLAVSSDLEEMGDRIGAADAAAHAAQEFHRQNLRGSRLTASGRATRLITECGATTPATRDVSAPLPLSNREREIASLVRDGLSNKEIADTLTMSIRTVEGHIYRACNKVGLANRAELGELIGQFAP